MRQAIPLMLAATLVAVAPDSLFAQAPDPVLLGEGATVYGDFCASCHNARASSERTDLEWVAIVLHMRARANLTKREAAAVLTFLQATNLPEGSASAAGRLDRDEVDPTRTVIPAELRSILSENAINGAAGSPSPAPTKLGDGR